VARVHITGSDNLRLGNVGGSDHPEPRRLPNPLHLPTYLKEAVAEHDRLSSKSLNVPESAYSATRAVLEDAERLLTGVGWAPHFAWTNAEGKPALESEEVAAYSLAGAIACAGCGTIVAEYARRAVRAALREQISDYEAHPLRTKKQVLGAIRRAMRLVGGEPARRGGWLVSP
jgi:hypothetical protein